MPIHIPPGDPSPDLENSFTHSAIGKEWSALECARTLYRRKATLLWIAFFGIIAATLFSVAQPRTYQSQASIQIQGINENFLNLRDAGDPAGPVIVMLNEPSGKRRLPPRTKIGGLSGATPDWKIVPPAPTATKDPSP